MRHNPTSGGFRHWSAVGLPCLDRFSPSGRVSATMNMNSSKRFPARESSSNSWSRGVSESLPIFERPVSGDWLLEGEATSSGEPNNILINATPFQVGRRSSNNLTISNRTVSGRHAELLVDNGELRLKDHSSTNGTFLNGKRVNSLMPVSDGDVIHFGKVRFTVRKNVDSAPAPRWPSMPKAMRLPICSSPASGMGKRSFRTFSLSSGSPISR